MYSRISKFNTHTLLASYPGHPMFFNIVCKMLKTWDGQGTRLHPIAMSVVL